PGARPRRRRTPSRRRARGRAPPGRRSRGTRPRPAPRRTPSALRRGRAFRSFHRGAPSGRPGSGAALEEGLGREAHVLVLVLERALEGLLRVVDRPHLPERPGGGVAHVLVLLLAE